MIARWHSRCCVTISYRRDRETWLVKRLGEVISAVAIVIVGGALARLLFSFLRLRNTGLLRVPGTGFRSVVAPRNWWSSASWISEIPQPASLLSATLADQVVDVWLGCLLSGVWWLLKRCLVPNITEEQLTISQGLGLQIRWLSGSQTKFVKFIPIEKVQEVAVVEAFQNSRVITILALVLKDEKQTVVPFRHTLPYEEDLYVIQDAMDQLMRKF